MKDINLDNNDDLITIVIYCSVWKIDSIPYSTVAPRYKTALSKWPFYLLVKEEALLYGITVDDPDLVKQLRSKYVTVVRKLAKKLKGKPREEVVDYCCHYCTDYLGLKLSFEIESMDGSSAESDIEHDSKLIEELDQDDDIILLDNPPFADDEPITRRVTTELKQPPVVEQADISLKLEAHGVIIELKNEASLQLLAKTLVVLKEVAA